MKLINIVLLGSSILLSGIVTAETGAPEHPQQVVEKVTRQVLGALKKLNEVGSNKPEAVSAKVKELIVPHLDFKAISKKVLGKHWRNANEKQRNDFAEQFEQLLIRTYETSLSKYSEEKVQFLPFHEGKRPDKLAIVKSEVIRSSGPTIPINYSLLKKPGVEWKVYDIGIEGISLVTNYRSSFSREIEQKGMDSLIKSLVERNASRKTAAKS